MAFIYMNSRILRRLDVSRSQLLVETTPPGRWETSTDTILLQMEDDFQSHWAGQEQEVWEILSAAGYGDPVEAGDLTEWDQWGDLPAAHVLDL